MSMNKYNKGQCMSSDQAIFLWTIFLVQNVGRRLRKAVCMGTLEYSFHEARTERKEKEGDLEKSIL